MSLEKILDKKSLDILQEIDNKKVEKTIEEFVDLCKPEKVTILSDSKEDVARVSGLCAIHHVGRRQVRRHGVEEPSFSEHIEEAEDEGQSEDRGQDAPEHR